MEIVENKALILRTRNPQKYECIPNSANLGLAPDGVYEVAVRWELDEVRVLRNLGVKNAPSPIEGRYTWPGRHKPFNHQRETSAFLTLYNRAFVFSEPGCVDSDTEYLSPTGWVKISEYQSGMVAQYHPDSGAVEFVAPQAFVKKPCESMIRFKTTHGVDQLLSPEHRMLIASNAKNGGTRVVSAADMLEIHNAEKRGDARSNFRRAGSSTVSMAHAAIPSTFSFAGGSGIPLTDAQIRVQIAAIADAHFANGTTRCAVRLKRERKKLRLRALLQDAGIQFKERSVDTATAQEFTVFTFNAPQRLKEFDASWWVATAAQLAVVRDEVLHWDGTIRGGAKGGAFFSTSKASADFVQFAFASGGVSARIAVDTHRERPCYVVRMRGPSRSGLLALRSRLSASAWEEPSTDGFKYCFTVPSTFLLFRRNGCVFASGNTGKTMSAIWAADFLMNIGRVRKVLVLCPLSIMQSAWHKDIASSAIHRSAVVAHHVEAERRIRMVNHGYDFTIVNYDGLPMIADALKKRGDVDLVIVDEANAYKNPQTKRWKVLNSLLTPDTMLWMMTGTPAAQSPIDAFGLAKLVNPSGVPRFQTAWKDEVMTQITRFKWVAKASSRERVHTALQPAIRFTKKECLDLPPVLTATREVPLTPQQAKYYKIIKTQMLSNVAGETISAVNAAAVVNKLLQISAGAAYTDNHEVVEFDCGPRLQALMEVIDETPNKAIVFAHYRHSIDTIYQHVAQLGVPCEMIHGGISPTRRSEIFHNFQTKPDPRVLVIQDQAASHGVTLTAADTVVFWGPVMSVETYLQCIARTDRIGQASDKVTVVHIQGSDIERKMFKQLESRVADHDLFVKLYEEISAEGVAQP